jgi:hypothetical protein
MEKVMVVPELVTFPDLDEAVSQLARLLIEYLTEPLEALRLYLNVDGENGPPCGPEATMLVEGVSSSDCPRASCDEKRGLAKIRTNAPSIPAHLKCKIAETRAVILSPTSQFTTRHE